VDSNAQIKLGDVVHSYLNENGEAIDNFFRYLQIVIEGLTQLNVKTSYGVKVYFTEVNSVNIVDYPADLIQISRIGVVKEGVIWSLTQNDSIALPNGDVCGVEVVSDVNLSERHIPTSLNYAKGGGYNFADYRIDHLNRRIVFIGALTNETIVIEYKSSGISMDGDTFLPVSLLPVLKEYLNWTLTKRNKQAPQAEKQRARIDYINARNDYVKTKHAFSMDDLLDAVYSGIGQGVKR
jgi:hypothetical protein